MIIADLHAHGRFSRGTSKDLTIVNMEKYARMKGVNLLGTGDFTHPKWVEELKRNLPREQDGIYYTKTDFPFLLQTEISFIYSEGGKGRRIHLIVWAPSFEVAEQVTEYLKTKGRVDYDGRPIFSVPCPDFVERVKEISKDIEIIPAHIWTPWYSLFGSKSGFDSVRECFQDQEKHIHAVETGLSSDPPMNWRLSQLDRYALVSFSDLHSFWPWRIGREATLFDTKFSYGEIINAVRNNQVKETIEVNPNYGKYHYDGHRNCGVCFSPKESIKHKGLCPRCGSSLVIGVEYRVEQLADRKEGYSKKGTPAFKTLIPLSELLSAANKCGVATQKIWKQYNELIRGHSEYYVLLEMPEEEIVRRTNEKIAAIIIKNRAGNIKVIPGYDGVYGELVLENETGQESQEDLGKHL